MRFNRAAGILLHPTSLPSRFAIGDFGAGARRFVDFLSDAGVSHWQILPLSPAGHGNSPYSAYSAFAVSTLLVSPEQLVDEGLLRPSDISSPPHSEEPVDFDTVRVWKDQILATAHSNFLADATADLREGFAEFQRDHSWWLDDYALFRALKSANGELAWFDWKQDIKLRTPSAVAKAKEDLANQIQVEQFSQFLVCRQWAAIKKYANENGVRVIGDIPIFVALDSADVWCNQDEFKLNTDGSPTVVSGVI